MYGKCGERDPNHTESECEDVKCANCDEQHPAFSRTFEFYKREKEIMHVKHRKNIPFPEARKIVESYIGTRTYANIAQKTNQKPQDITPIDKYKKLIKKTYEWPTFQENIKRIYLTEIKQNEPSTKTKLNANTNEEILKENSTLTKSANEKRQKSPIRPPDINRDIIEKTKDTAFKKQNSF